MVQCLAHPEILRMRPEEVHQLLCLAKQATSEGLSVPDWWMEGCPLATLMAGSVQHSSIKVYLTLVRFLHIEKAFPDHLVNCLCLLWVIWIQGSRSPAFPSYEWHLDDHLQVLRFIDFWPLHVLGCMQFGLHWFSVINGVCWNMASFSPALHPRIRDISVDSDTNPSCLRETIRRSKTEPFREGCFVHIGRGCFSLFPRTILTTRIREILAGAEVQGTSPATVFTLLWPQWQLVVATQITLWNPRAFGLVPPISHIIICTPIV